MYRYVRQFAPKFQLARPQALEIGGFEVDEAAYEKFLREFERLVHTSKAITIEA